MKKKRKNGFTLLEMLIVLGIIAVLFLLFIPNIIKQSDNIQGTEKETITNVVKTQRELYTLEKNEKPTSLDMMYQEKYLTKKQFEKAQKLSIPVDVE